MEEQQLKTFVDSVTGYFNNLPESEVNVGTPYLIEKESLEATDVFSGVIGISGNRTGWLRYSAPRIMVKHLLLAMGERDTSDSNVKDMVGEVANTISGNLRKAFGSDFLISVPQVVYGQDAVMKKTASHRCYVVPIYWRHYNSSMVVYLH